MPLRLAKNILLNLVAIPSLLGVASLFFVVFDYSGDRIALLCRLSVMGGLASAFMWWLGSHADEDIGITMAIGTWGGVPTIGWYLVAGYGLSEIIGIPIAMLASMVTTMAIVIVFALIHGEFLRRITDRAIR